MNSEQLPPLTFDAPAPTGDAVAAAYLAEELPKARQSLKRTRIVGIILILFVGAYFSVISTIMVRFFRPKEAAEVASGMLARQVAAKGPVLALHVEREIPPLIGQVPDYLIKEIPGFRQQLQVSLESECDAYCNSLSRDLGARMDTLIDEHKAEIGTLLKNASDREAIHQTLPDFDKMITEAMNNNAEGQAAKERIDQWAAALKEAENRMDRLANGSDLTPEEQKARHALAMLSTVIKDNTQIPENISVLATPLEAKAKQ